MIRSISLAVLIASIASSASAQHALLQVDADGVVQGLIPGGAIAESPPAGWRWLRVRFEELPAREAFTQALVPTLRVSGTLVLRRPQADIMRDADRARRQRARAALISARGRLDAIERELADDPANQDLESARAEAQADVTRLRQEAQP